MVLFNEGYREFTLGNRLGVALQKTATRTISGRLRIFHGAINERKGEEGIAHLLEHTLRKSGAYEYSAAEADRMRTFFGHSNGGTYVDKTVFNAGLLPEYLETCLKFFSGIAFRPNFDSERFEEERKRVLRESSDEKGAADFADIQAYKEALFGNSPQNYFLLGKDEVVASATIDMLAEFHSRGYYANNMDLIIVGDLPGDTENLVRKYFDVSQNGKGARFMFPSIGMLEQRKIMHTFAPELYNQENPQESSAHLMIGIIVPSERSDEYFTLSVLADILGKDESSRLFAAVSQHRGLAYEIGSGYEATYNAGFIQIEGKIVSSEKEQAIETVFGEMRRLQSHPVRADELEKVWRDARFKTAKILEENELYADAIETKLDQGIALDDFMARIEAVTPEMIMEAAQKYLPGSRDDNNYVLMIRDPLLKE